MLPQKQCVLHLLLRCSLYCFFFSCRCSLCCLRSSAAQGLLTAQCWRFLWEATVLYYIDLTGLLGCNTSILQGLRALCCIGQHSVLHCILSPVQQRLLSTILALNWVAYAQMSVQISLAVQPASAEHVCHVLSLLLSEGTMIEMILARVIFNNKI